MLAVRCTNMNDSVNATAIPARSSSAVWRRYGKFCVVGGSGVVVDMVVLYLLADRLGWNLTLGKVIAAEVAIFNNFLWNDWWTFRGLGQERNRWEARLARLGKFNLICVTGIGLSVLLLNGQVYGLGLNVYLANFIAIVLVSLWNFFLNLRFGWNSPVLRANLLQPRMDANRHE